MKSLTDIFNIAGKRILLTGAAGYLGQYMVKGLLGVGADLLLLSRSEKKLKGLQEECNSNYPNRVESFVVDNYNHDELRETLLTLTGLHGIDVLINNAYDVGQRTGFNTPSGSLANSTEEQWESSFDCTYWAVLTTQIIGNQMMERKAGSIINVASMYSLISPNPELYDGTGTLNPPTYSVSKAAICALTRYTASFWGSSGIRCNAILPGAFPNTDCVSENAVKPSGVFMKLLRKRERTSLQRLGDPRELIGLLIYLASDASSYMTGQSLVIDGGWTIR